MKFGKLYTGALILRNVDISHLPGAAVVSAGKRVGDWVCEGPPWLGEGEGAGAGEVGWEAGENTSPGSSSPSSSQIIFCCTPAIAAKPPTDPVESLLDLSLPPVTSDGCPPPPPSPPPLV